MPSQLALVLTLALIVFLYRRESREEASKSRALWIPLIWVLITGSRFPTQWLTIWGVPIDAASLEEGSPLDAAFFLALIFIGFLVLKRRQVSVAKIARNNAWLTIFFVYCFLSIAWSDFQFIAFKRWIKTLGHPIMVMIILTEPNPIEAMRSVFKRMAYVLIPCSVLFIKYYPQYGRGFDSWTGAPFNQGVNLNKNELGYVCFLSGLFFFWNLLQARQIKERAKRRAEFFLSLSFLLMIAWLLRMAHSATSQTCLIIGMLTMAGLGVRVVNKRHLGKYVVAGIIFLATAQAFFGIYENAILMLGRNPNLTDRTEVWSDVLKLVSNPVLGAGFESFWLGERLDTLWAKWWWHPSQAHDGYIETYLNLGWVGVFLLLGLILATFGKIRTGILKDFEFGRFRMGCFLAILVYNYTEAAFKGVSLVWTVFFLIAMDYPQARETAVAPEPVQEKLRAQQPEMSSLPARGT